mmetsp:Transcript_41506/g.60878  ORF Transcript_41506/g.60878 Transcript_41506/m.60878 type:complete len:188 (-) Transcript_41506:192-755(-)|eukprot:CAMPEP_0195530348 /NCGR_PEP_ID=MMETSP0794_2-20130614/33200_1 /TAXON_ID=515487 /ORGANISM="Stephanopyxis turris, Strain CCMP 815" /LENGTH=187 /DNA_ID=CAMNT_0040661837 /DNA_START=158 /DNA_END=721 /DNA_ORIENTATION=-
MSDSEEPVSKKAKVVTGWEDHKMNCSEALMKSEEGKLFSVLADDPVNALQGIGPKADKVLEVLKIRTIRELATYKFFIISRALATLAKTETDGGRDAQSVMNVDQAVDKEYESKSLVEIVGSPVSALQGLTEDADALLKDLGVSTINDLANLKYCLWSESIVVLGQYEHSKNASERKAEALQKQLAN